MAACFAQSQKKKKKEEETSCFPEPEPVILKKPPPHEATTCPLCTKRHACPKLLPCFHTICLPCLRRRCARGKSHGDFIKCPVCHCKFIVPENGVEDFQADFVVEYLLHEDAVPDKEKRSACESCPTESDGLPVEVPMASSYCTDCFMKLCEDCAKPHTRLRGKHHRILTLGKKVKPHTPASGRTCENHSNGQSEQSCFDCQANICELCHTCKYKQTQDMCEQISDKVRAFMQQLEDDIEAVTSAICAIQSDLSRLNKEKRCFIDEIAKTEVAIVTKGDEVKKLVDMQVDSLVEQLGDIKSKVLEKLALAVADGTACVLSMRGLQNFAEVVKSDGTPAIIARVATELDVHSRAQLLVKWQQESKVKQYRMPNIVFDSADIESFACPTGGTGGLIGRVSVVDYTPTVKATVLDGDPILGLTFLKPCLYVVRQKSSEVEVYCPVTFKLQRRILVNQGLIQAKDMAADRRHNTLYIADYKKQVIHRLQVTGAGDQCEWQVGEKPSSLSVDANTHQLLVTCGDARKLVEFSAHGCVLREICLHRDAVIVHHAVTLITGNIVASIGTGRPNSPVHRVTVVDADGRCGRGPSFTVVGPAHLAAIPGDESSGHLLVGDNVGGRVVLLSSALTSIRVLATRNHGLRRVARLAVDAPSRRFYVADNVPDMDAGCCSSGRVMVFSI